MEHCDVLVVGGGPAGLLSAIMVAQAGLRAVVLETKAGPIDKACGEGLMPAAVSALQHLGVDLSAGSPFVGIRYLDHRDPTLVAEGCFPSGPGLGLRRHLLHQALLACAASWNIPCVQHNIKHVSQGQDGVWADRWHGRYLIAADGLHSAIRRQLQLQLPPRLPKRFGVRQHFAVAPWSSHVEVYWSPRAEAYVTPVSADSVGVAFLFSRPGDFESLLAEFPLLRERLGEPISSVRGAGPFEQRLRARSVGRILLVGDAAGYLDPITGEGIALGYKTARAAVDCIVQNQPQQYNRRWTQIMRRYHWLTHPLLFAARTPWLRRKIIPVLRKFPGLFDLILRWWGEDGTLVGEDFG